MTRYIRRIMRQTEIRLLLIAIFTLTIGLATAISRESKKTKPPAIDPYAYEDMMSRKVSDIYGLEALFTDQQDFFLPINPPSPDFILHNRDFLRSFPSTHPGFPRNSWTA